MSHSVVWVLIDGKTKPANVEGAVTLALAPFDENKEVKKYKTDCSCVGQKAQEAARAKADKGGTVNEIRDRFHSDLATADLRKRGHEYPDLDKLGITLAEWKVANKAVNRLWQEAMAPYKARLQRALDAHPQKDQPDEKCEECKGKGKVSSTYNPKSKWDWWVIGGRWAGRITASKVPDDENPFTTGNHASAEQKTRERNSIRVNTRLVSEILALADEEFLPFAILAPGGEWHERGSMGWWGIVSDEKDDWADKAREVLAANVTCLAVAVDVHI